MKTIMSSHHHSNPIVSIIFGTIFSIYGAVSEIHFVPTSYLEFFLQLFRVISFGVIGGACGYVGKIWAMRIHNYLKQKSKDVCNFKDEEK